MSFGTLFEVPYFNALTAGEFDASSSFDANMPASHVAYSLQTLGLYQSPGQTQRPDVLEWQEAPTIGAPPPGYKMEEMCVDDGGNIVPKGTPGAQCSMVMVRDAGLGAGLSLPNLPGSLNEFLTGPVAKDVAKRVGLVIVAVVLIVVAIVSLR